MNRKTIVAAVVVLVVIAAGGFLAENVWRMRVSAANSVAIAANAEEQKGVMPTAEYERLARLESTTGRTRMISDSDLAWDISELKARPTADNFHNESDLHALSIAPIAYASNRTAKQRTMVLDAVLPYAADSNHDASLRAVAVMLVGQTGRRDDLALLKERLTDPDSGVRSAAAAAIARIEAVQPSIT